MILSLSAFFSLSSSSLFSVEKVLILFIDRQMSLAWTDSWVLEAQWCKDILRHNKSGELSPLSLSLFLLCVLPPTRNLYQNGPINQSVDQFIWPINAILT